MFLVMVFGLLAVPSAAQGAEETLELVFNRDFGYGGFGGDIQGRFSLKVRSPNDLVRVAYFLDGELVFEGTEPPFLWQFNTANYPEGRHTFTAIAYKSDGDVLESDSFTRVFLTPEQAWGNTGNIILPILILVGIATVGGVLGPVLLGRKKTHTPGVYGIAGGAVCPRCTFPYARSVLAPNLLVGKLMRCPHCGKWAIVPGAAVRTLVEAEERLVAESQTGIEMDSDTEKLGQMIDDSRFED